MANPEGNAARFAQADLILNRAARESGSDEALEQFYIESRANAVDPEEQHSIMYLAAAKLFARAVGMEPEEEDLSDEVQKPQFSNPETGELYEKSHGSERVQEINDSQGQGPLPEDAQAGDALTDAQVDGSEAASNVSEEDREALDAQSDREDVAGEADSDEDQSEVENAENSEDNSEESDKDKGVI